MELTSFQKKIVEQISNEEIKSIKDFIELHGEFHDNLVMPRTLDPGEEA